VLNVSPIQDKMHKAADKSYANCSLRLCVVSPIMNNKSDFVGRKLMSQQSIFY